MHRGIGGTAFEPAETRRDREVTLGPTMLVLLGLGLFTLCGVCFVFGYAVGQHVSPPEAAKVQAATATGTPGQNLSAQAKPSASQNSFQPRPTAEAQPTTSTSDDPATKTSDAGQPPQSPPASPQPAQSTAQNSAAVSPAAVSSTDPKPAPPVVKAVPLAPSGGQQAPVSTGSVVRPAFPQTSTQPGTWMVQIAAVSHPGDAEVLVSALRRRGYAVAVYRDPVDTLMHVQVGPFSTRNDATAMRQKLLNDGYNAIVQP
jgi:DedD protein